MKAYELLDSPEKLARGVFATTASGETLDCGWDHPEAACWCMVGAMFKCYPVVEISPLEDKILAVLGTNRYETKLTRWSDTHTYEEVIAVLKEADV